MKRILTILGAAMLVIVLVLPTLAAAQSAQPTPVESSTWGRIKSLYSSPDASAQRPDQLQPQAMPQLCFYINVPWMSQMPPKSSADSDATAWVKTNNCGQAIGVMLGGYFNHGTVQPWVIDAENDWLHCPKPYGCQTGSSTLQYLLSGFHALRSSVYYGNGADDVVAEGARGRPVIVGVRTHMSTNGRPHWMLFIGWDGTYMYFNDPGRSSMSSNWTAGHFRCTPGTFFASWNSFPDHPRTYIPVYR